MKLRLIFAFLLNPFNLFNPITFPFGAESWKIIINTNNVTKYFLKTKKHCFINSLYFLEILKYLDFIPKLIDYNIDSLTITTTNCGDLVNITTNLPNNWELQLNEMRLKLITTKILFPDVTLWDINPNVINNLCVKNNYLYLIDFGDCRYVNDNEIDILFETLVNNIKLQKNTRWFRYYFYLMRIHYGVNRKIKRFCNCWVYFFYNFI
jgi:hypothetical protein